MALQKTENYKGVDSNYWKILNLNPDYVSGYTAATLGLYKDSDARQDSVANILKSVAITASGLYESRDTMYPQCKASGQYLEGASDC